MATPNVYYPHAIITPETDLTQLNNVRASHNFQDLVEYSSGQSAPQLAGSQFAVPDIVFDSPQIGGVLTDIDTGGIAKDFSAGNIDLHYKQGAPHGIRTADASLAHVRIRLEANAMLIWNSIKAAQGSLAEINCRFLPVWDGVNDPMVATGSLALAGTSQAAHVYTLGRIDINATDQAGVQDADWQNNIEMEEVSDSGEGFLTYAGIKRFAPTLVYRTRNTEAISDFGTKGTALTSLEFYLRKLQPNGLLVPNATAEHIKFTASAGVIKARAVEGDDSMAEVFVQMIKASAVADPFTITVASAIT